MYQQKKKIPGFLAACLCVSLLAAPLSSTYAEYPVYDSEANKHLGEIQAKTSLIYDEIKIIKDNTETIKEEGQKSNKMQEADISSFEALSDKLSNKINSFTGDAKKLINVATSAFKNISTGFKDISSSMNNMIASMHITLNDPGTFVLSQGSRGTDGQPAKGGLVIKVPGCFGGKDTEIVVASEQETHDVLQGWFPSLGTLDSNGNVTAYRKDQNGIVDVTPHSNKQAALAAIGFLMASNEKVLNSYQKLNGYLMAYQKQLDGLLELNAQLGKDGTSGSVSAQQLANDISYVRGKIANLQMLMKALDAQQRIYKSQAESQVKMNDEITARAQEAVNRKSCEDSGNAIDSQCSEYEAKYGQYLTYR